MSDTATTTEHRPWGSFTVLEDTARCKVKRLAVMPGQRLSLQKHLEREEHWVVVAGTPEVTVGSRQWTAHPGEYIHIPRQAIHRIANPGQDLVEIVEVQLGDACREEDIIRLEDDYNRA